MAKTVEMYEVLKVFRDKETQKRYIVGASYPGKDPERITELQEAGYLAAEPQAQDAPKSGEKKEKEPDVQTPDKGKADEVTPDADDAGKS
ncbi:hypothetical protein [Paenibacillus sp. FSL H8-0259]|uniref:hypothetical protein n=1 Tax=Paenibacillus sp. FSL H8-0259 TaxID=1920423 RepID=UPI00096C392B|nr:hypothetical protein [Paenibacillus sp. FSL H8-0259]OMF28310.1 hypothetical protein BK132_14730 [Paenibacillus sp. FSL H8-0259]